MSVGTDVGGTFTDIIVQMTDGSVHTSKVPTTSSPEQGILDALMEMDIVQVGDMSHGTTVCTNALIQRTGTRTAFITTKGFGSLLFIGRQDRPSLYDWSVARPRHFVEKEDIFEIDERIGPGGEILRPIDEDEVDALADMIKKKGFGSVAVCLLNSYIEPSHETSLGDALLSRKIEHSLSHVIDREFREYERFSTTVINAYVSPLLSDYIQRLRSGMACGSFHLMLSNGGVLSPEHVSDIGVRTILSGPAGGVSATASFCATAGIRDAITLDMGGTSADVATIVEGTPTFRSESDVHGLPVRTPMVDIETVGAGGGSLVWLDDGGALRVGPMSAGADPGPACYGKGGNELTITDCNLLAGRIPDGITFGSSIDLEIGLAEAAAASIAEVSGLEIDLLITGALSIVDSNMVKPIRTLTVSRGIDPADFTLIPFGGSGPLHAAGVAEEIGISMVVIPPSPGTFSAFGVMSSPVMFDDVVPLPHDATMNHITEQLNDSKTRCARRVDPDGAAEGDGIKYEAWVEMCYHGQSYELRVPVAKGEDLGTLRTRFHRMHERLYGHSNDELIVETVNLRTRASVDRPLVEFGSLPETTYTSAIDIASSPEVLFGARQRTKVLYRGSLKAGKKGKGPAVIYEENSTTLVPPGWKYTIGDLGEIRMVRS